MSSFSTKLFLFTFKKGVIIGFAETNYDVDEGDSSANVTVCVDLTGQIDVSLALSVSAEGAYILLLNLL